MKSNKSKISFNKGFTLIELLVVVLIIGILAAVALPQYQKAVEKTKGMEAIAILKEVHAAQTRYFLEHGTYSEKLDDLDIKIPYTGKQKSINNYVIDWKSNVDWSLHLYQDLNGINLHMVRLRGPYQGGEFATAVYHSTQISAPLEFNIMCNERPNLNNTIKYTRNIGDYCEKIFQGVLVNQKINQRYGYSIPNFPTAPAT